jgi:TolB-like protein/Tfp pilus assembly protein PilF
MFTDIVGYSSLVRRNETLGLELLTQHKALLRSCLLRHSGKEIKTMGDGFLVEFASALEAVQCGLAIQSECHDSNSKVPPDRRVVVRIGIHVGDVVHSERDVYGDAVNVASRIEPLAKPGEICMTQQVYDHVRNKLDVPVEYLGKRTLKNLELPVELYTVGMPSEMISLRPAVTPSQRRIAVLPLANISPNPKDEYFADGLTEELISTVSKVGDLRVISRTSAMKYKGSKKAVGEIAHELAVGVVLEGSVRKAADKIRINLQLIDVQTDESLWSQSYDRELSDVFAIQSDVARSVADALQIHLIARDKQKIEKKPTENIEAYNLYLKGLHYRGEETGQGYKRAIRYFEEALRKDSRFALAYAGLADCHARLAEDGIVPPEEGYPHAKEFALKALELDEGIAEAHVTLGAVLDDYYFDLSSAEREFKLALNLNPNYGKVCHSYGAHLGIMGRLDEAIAEINRATELNPLGLEVNNCAAVIFNSANQLDRALETCQTMLRIDEDYFPAYQDLAEVYLQMGMFDEAIASFQKAVTISNGAATQRGRLGFAYGVSGRKAEAKKMLQELEEDSKRTYVSPIALALVHCGLGNKNEALRYLEKAYEERSGGLLSIKVRPLWTSLRPDPRFKTLLHKIGLERK